MLDALEIRKEIARLEYEESSYSNYAKLATLYAIRNEMNGGAQAVETAEPSVREQRTRNDDCVGDYGSSDFLRAVSGCSASSVWAILDELMSTLYAINERVYDAVLNKIKAL